MLGGGKKHEQNTKQDTLSLFLQWEYKLGTQPSMEHSHNGVFVVFFPVSVLFVQAHFGGETSEACHNQCS